MITTQLTIVPTIIVVIVFIVVTAVVVFERIESSLLAYFISGLNTESIQLHEFQGYKVR